MSKSALQPKPPTAPTTAMRMVLDVDDEDGDSNVVSLNPAPLTAAELSALERMFAAGQMPTEEERLRLFKQARAALLQDSTEVGASPPGLEIAPSAAANSLTAKTRLMLETFYDQLVERIVSIQRHGFKDSTWDRPDMVENYSKMLQKAIVGKSHPLDIALCTAIMVWHSDERTRPPKSD